VAEQLLTDAAALAAECATLEQLRAAMEGFDAKAHFPAARNLVFADGNPQAKVMLIGEAPGEEEDRRGLPFVGRSGQLLDRMLAAIGLDRDSVYISNILPWRPMANRTPTTQEGVIFLPFLMRHIELAGPRLTMALGGSSAKLLLGTNQGIMRLRGHWSEIEVGERKVPLLPTLHPAFLLRNPLAKREAWADLLNLKQRLRELDAD
jgi:DNA polymerase